VPIKNLARGDRVGAQVFAIAEKKIFQSFVVKKKKLGEIYKRYSIVTKDTLCV